MEELKNNIAKQGLKVLIVDDVPENIQILVHLLKEKGLKVQFADSGIKALKAIKNNLPDLILLDVSMPDMDGFEVCRQLKSDELTSDIPVIFLTAKVDQQDVINGLEIGAVDYVTKPFNAKELISRVFTHLELKYTRDFIRRQNQELNRLNEIKNQLFSVISHDMKNLFNNILFGTESLEKEISSFSQAEIVQVAGVINDSAKSAFSLLQNLLDWSRSQIQNNQFSPTFVELRMIINQTLSLLKPIAAKKEIGFNVISEGTSFDVFADVEMLKSVVRNLVSNAIKYSYTKGNIDIRIRELPDGVLVSIHDKGMGMSREQMKKLRSNGSLVQSQAGTLNEKGSGLGLLLIRDFIDKNKGKFDFESKAGKGSTFWFELPSKRA